MSAPFDPSVDPVPDPLPVEPAGPVDATVRLPGSKSITNRALLCAALADGRSRISGALEADDTVAMATALEALGAEVDRSDDQLAIRGTGTLLATTVDARQSGTTARFLLPVLALDGQDRTLDGDAQLRARPMAPAFEALRSLGARIEEQGEPGHLPAVVRGPVRGGSVAVSGDVSSQFLSGLLLAAPLVDEGLDLRVTSELVSRPYVEMTLAVMQAFGARVEEHGDRWRVLPGRYRACDYIVEPDASAASYAWAAAVVTAGAVTVEGLHRDSLQGDVAFAEVLGAMGAEVTWHTDAVTVRAGDALKGIDVDMAHISDTVPTLAVVAALAEGPTTIRGVGFIRGKETDRILAPVTELRRCGVDAEATDDGMVIRPRPLDGATFDSYGDHRMAMAFALLGLVVPGVAVRDPGCVAKTFPGYWQLLDALRAGSFPPARSV